MKTRVLCVLIVLAGFLLHSVVTHFSFKPDHRLTEPIMVIFIAYMALVPVVLYFLRGDRLWRLAVFGIWVLYVALWAYAMLTLD